MPRPPTLAPYPFEVKAGDGFTPEEVETTLKPTLHKWQPRCDYDEVDIGSLEPGPGCVMLVGRVVNLFREAKSSKTPNGAKGCLRLIVKDDTGALSVLQTLPLQLEKLSRFLGYTVVRENRLSNPSRPSGINLDVSPVHCWVHVPDFAEYFAQDLDFS